MLPWKDKYRVSESNRRASYRTFHPRSFGGGQKNRVLAKVERLDVPVDIFSQSDSNYLDFMMRIIDGVNDSIIGNAYAAEIGKSLEFLDAGWSGSCGGRTQSGG
jgi:hypothetical protein